MAGSKQTETIKGEVNDIVQSIRSKENPTEFTQEPVKLVLENIETSNTTENEEIIPEQEEKEVVNQEPVLESISIDNILISEKPKDETSQDYAIKQIEKSELLYKKLGVVAYNNVPFCGICRENFSTSMELLIHCFEKHPFELTDELRNLSYLLGNFPTYPTDSQIYEKSVDLHFDLLFKPPIEIPEKPTAELFLNVPRFFGELIIELFGCDIPEEERCRIPKSNWNDEVVWLQLPYKIPFLFMTNGNKMKIGFIETPQVSAETARSLLKSVLNVISKNQFLVIQLNNIAKSSFSIDDIKSLSSTYDVRILVKRDDHNNSSSIILFIYSTNWTTERANTITSVINEYFKKSILYQCTICKEFFKLGEQTLCTNAQMGVLVISRKVPHSPSENPASSMTSELLKSMDVIKKFEI
ncbi:hypothetical protein TVAG_104500 [Trichomonas vaginalis G3]|uniref:Uncharacterized protein n=1 Tax=Trichomonas vaginalis (strain ATCC PRA-98 / G3) TaxID=412133 RepID=A2F698_TRIV3|nr:spectrin binding [Trichomonas vaginalis G3]EAX99569.1 hypothetical protein TVAG_104500 [Trichomonas vaginalis G3]KAI5490955.1 spectrin binding [Trichomonas vaginalis G3]|eukprot:XP_001312499.1 hypothetical protein [Trichomonas vaginalis G3]